MYFRSVIRVNPATQRHEGYYRLVESYRNEFGRVCHRTLHTVGFINYDVEKLVIVQRVLNNRLERKNSLFEKSDKQTMKIADKHKDAREVGAEWMCYQALKQLKLSDKLKALNWDEENITLALTQIISRAVYPFSENRTSRWIKENSAVCEITGYPIDKMTKDKLYKSALDLYKIKDQLEKHLSAKTNELFDLQDKIFIYDLSNTYFEGVKTNSKLAQFGRSKEKRSDCKIVVLAIVVNVEGFIKYSNIFEGNMSDSESLPKIIDNLRQQTSSQKRAVVVIDAGIATEDNLAIIQQKGYDYVCVSRSKIKDYSIKEEAGTTHIVTKNKQVISLQKVHTKQTSDYVLRVKSPGKEAKERSMKSQFETRFMESLKTISASFEKKGGIKKLDKVNRRIGRVIEKYPSVAKFYDIEVKSENKQATALVYTPKESYKTDEQELGSYFIRTNLDGQSEINVWTIYNAIRERQLNHGTPPLRNTRLLACKHYSLSAKEVRN